MVRRIVFWGGSSQALVLSEALDCTEFVLCLVVDREQIASPITGIPIVQGRDGLERWLEKNKPTDLHFSIAIGGTLGKDRIEIADYLISRRLMERSIIHRTAYIAKTARVGAGAQILANSTVCAGVTLGRQVIVNTAASIDHESIIGDGAHISAGARLAGRVRVDKFAFVGVGAIVLPDLVIGEGAVIGAGAVVTRSVAPGKVMVGNPARELPSGQAGA